MEWIKSAYAKEELSYTAVLSLLAKIDQAFPVHQPRIKLSGEEPFIRDDLIAVLYEIVRLNFLYGLMSNFCLTDMHVIDAFLACTPRFLNVSLDGDEQVHDSLWGRQGSYKATVEALTY